MFDNPNVEIFIPDHISIKASIERTTHLGIGAHQDDLEIMAIDGILDCFDHPDQYFAGVVMTDGRSSPRSGVYANLSDDEMMQVRYVEQQKAAMLGNYGALIACMYSSQAVKDKTNQEPTDDLVKLLSMATPKTVYTHNLADKHPTHVAVAIRVVEAIRRIEDHLRPKKLLGCEVWRGLDWLPDSMKVLLDCSTHIHLQETLLGVHDSQISGGKRYDFGTLGRRWANATFNQSHAVDDTTHLTYAMDLTPLIQDDSLEVIEFINEKIHAFQNEVVDLLTQFL